MFLQFPFLLGFLRTIYTRTTVINNNIDNQGGRALSIQFLQPNLNV